MEQSCVINENKIIINHIIEISLIFICLIFFIFEEKKKNTLEVFIFYLKISC